MKRIKGIREIESVCFSDPWSENSIISSLQNENTICFIQEQGTRIIGYVLGITAADECELHRIAVLPEFRRQGVAENLLNRFILGCEERGVKSIFLEVASKNTSAFNFYTKNKFSIISKRKGYYKDDDAIVMMREV